jgi:2-dehydropantoate 2-reductase
MNTNLLIVGTGALATLFAARLTQAGHRVTMLGTWKEGLDALRRDGARLVDVNENEHQFEVQAVDDPHECVGAKHALVLVKAWQTERAAQQLAECLADDGLVVTLQNGLGNRSRSAPQGESRSRRQPLARHCSSGSGEAGGEESYPVTESASVRLKA